MITYLRSALLLVAAAMSVGAAAVDAQQIRGRVVDDWYRSGIIEATVTLHAVGDTSRISQVATDADGFFTVRVPAPGEYRITVERIGYTGVDRTVTVGSEPEMTVPAFVLVSQAVRLDPIVAEGRSRSMLPGTAGGLRGANVLAGERLAVVERSGVSMSAVVRSLRAGLRVRHLNLPGGRSMMCVESIRGMPSFRAGVGRGDSCNMVTIVLDGMTVPGPLGYFQYLDVSQFESIEYLRPSEAGIMYGMEASMQGALVLWTRGRGPYRSRAR